MITLRTTLRRPVRCVSGAWKAPTGVCAVQLGNVPTKGAPWEDCRRLRPRDLLRGSTPRLNFGTSARATLMSEVERAQKILKVAPGCTPAELKEAYRAAAVENHPDRHPPEKRAAATKAFRRCSEAYALLKDLKDHGGAGKHGSQPTAREAQRQHVNAEQLFRETFGVMTDDQVLSAIMKNKVWTRAPLKCHATLHVCACSVVMFFLLHA